MNFSFLNEIILAAVLGIVQGVTEFLPISSTAHIRLVTYLLANGRDVGLTISNIIQFGTVIAIVQYFWSDLKIYFHRVVEILRSKKAFNEFWTTFQSWINFKNTEKTISGETQKTDLKVYNPSDLVLSQLIVGTIPIIIVGLLLKNFVENTRTIQEIAWFLLIGSAIMATSEMIHKETGKHKKPEFITVGEVVLIGLFQSIAVFPGISRSGATVSGALMLGRDRAKSVRFSFLLSIPAVGLAGFLDLFSFLKGLKYQFSLTPTSLFWSDKTIDLSILSLLIAVIFSYIFGLVCLKWLLKYLGSHTFKNFIIYRIILALAIFSLALPFFASFIK